MRLTASIAMASALLLAATYAAAAPDPTPDDYVKELKSAAAPTGAGVCENGEERDESGACPVVDDSASTRGFTLFSGAAVKPQTTPKTSSPTVAAARDVRPAQPAVCGLLCDLKVTFKSGSTELTPESEARLRRFAAALGDASLARKRFEIAAHTDASGSPEKNRSLSQARAEVVRAFLVSHGVAASRLEARGYGAEGLAFPAVPTDPRNRRIEARVLN